MAARVGFGTMLILCLLGLGSFQAVDAAFTWSLGVRDRLQFDNNDGYCGETSLMMAGLKFGQYTSQYDTRQIVNPTTPIEQAQWHQYLILSGQETDNSVIAAKGMHLNYDTYNAVGTAHSSTATVQDYLVWCKKMMRRGAAVTVTVYNKGQPVSKRGFDYDHIVSISSWTSAFDDDTYHPEDVIVLADHYGLNRGLGGPGCLTEDCLEPNIGPDFGLITYTAGTIFGTREQSYAVGAPTWMIPSDKDNFSIAHTGVKVASGEQLLPVRITTSVYFEKPEVIEGIITEPAGTSRVPVPRPLARAMLLTVTISNLTPGAAYRLYAYDNERFVPESGFAAGNQANTLFVVDFSPDAAQTERMFTYPIMSSDKRFFRASKIVGPAPTTAQTCASTQAEQRMADCRTARGAAWAFTCDKSAFNAPVCPVGQAYTSTGCLPTC